MHRSRRRKDKQVDMLFGTTGAFLASIVAAILSVAFSARYLHCRSAAHQRYREVLKAPVELAEELRFDYHDKRQRAFMSIVYAFIALGISGALSHIAPASQFAGQIALLALIITLIVSHSVQRAEDRLLDEAIS